MSIKKFHYSLYCMTFLSLRVSHCSVFPSMSWILRTSEASRRACSGRPQVCRRDKLRQLKGFSSLGDQNQPNIFCSSFVQCILWSRDISIYYDSCSVSLNVVVYFLELRGNTPQPRWAGEATLPLPTPVLWNWFIVVILVFNILVVGTELGEVSRRHRWGCGHKRQRQHWEMSWTATSAGDNMPLVSGVPLE